MQRAAPADYYHRYTDTTSQQVYRDYIKLLVDRYKCSPAIFAWELANEPRCNGCPISTIYAWAKGTSAYIKSLDSKHMVTLGDECWFAPPDSIGDGSYAYSGAEGVDFVLNLGISTMDYGTFHLYPDSCKLSQMSVMRTTMTDCDRGLQRDLGLYLDHRA